MEADPVLMVWFVRVLLPAQLGSEVLGERCRVWVDGHFKRGRPYCALRGPDRTLGASAWALAREAHRFVVGNVRWDTANRSKFMLPQKA